ncbi:MAG: hypothetical protein LBT40_17850 [Deltaproteobacteria bacterium]|jgi:CBS domain containing-hemolysin-like protein|nr:hypothetical protein [Deltaproteobacteria bacterium]
MPSRERSRTSSTSWRGTIVELQEGWALCQTTVYLGELGRHVKLKLAAETEENYRTLVALLAGRFSESPMPVDIWTGYWAQFVVVSADGPVASGVRVKSLPETESEPKTDTGDQALPPFPAG